MAQNRITTMSLSHFEPSSALYGQLTVHKWPVSRCLRDTVRSARLGPTSVLVVGPDYQARFTC